MEDALGFGLSWWDKFDNYGINVVKGEPLILSNVPRKKAPLRVCLIASDDFEPLLFC